MAAPTTYEAFRRDAIRFGKLAKRRDREGDIFAAKRLYGKAAASLNDAVRCADMPSKMKDALTSTMRSYSKRVQDLGGMFRIRGGEIINDASLKLKEHYGLQFDENGKLCHFKYTDEDTYVRIGDLSCSVLHEALVKRYGMIRITLAGQNLSHAAPPSNASPAVRVPSAVTLAARKSAERRGSGIKAGEVLPTSQVFGTPNWKTAKVLLVIVHGAGAVRAGMWARKLLLNRSMETGTCLPWLDRVRDLATKDWGVLLLSPNDNAVDSKTGRVHINKNVRPKSAHVFPKKKPKIIHAYVKGIADGGPPIRVPRKGSVLIRGSENPQRHVLTAWRELISQTEAAKRCRVLVAAHSWGGVSTVSLLRHRLLGPSARRAIAAVAFLDSVHRHPEPNDASRKLFVCGIDGNEQRQMRPQQVGGRGQRSKTATDRFLEERGRTWVKSKLPLDRSVTPLSRFNTKGTVCVSAGTPDHDLCPAYAMPSVFKFFIERLRREDDRVGATRNVRGADSDDEAYSQPLPHSVVHRARWQFEDGRKGSGVWKDVAPADGDKLEKAFRKGHQRLQITNRFGTYAIELGKDPKKFLQRSLKTRRERRLRRCHGSSSAHLPPTPPATKSAEGSGTSRPRMQRVRSADAATKRFHESEGDVSNSVIWEYEDGSRGSEIWRAYSAGDSQRLERAFRGREIRFRLNNDHGSYIINLHPSDRKKWMQKSLRSSFKRRIRRRRIAH